MSSWTKRRPHRWQILPPQTLTEIRPLRFGIAGRAARFIRCFVLRAGTVAEVYGVSPVGSGVLALLVRVGRGHYQLARPPLDKLVVEPPTCAARWRFPHAQVPHKLAARGRPLLLGRSPARPYEASLALLQVLALMQRHNDPVLRRAAVQVVQPVD